jgi:hypothetical protein
LVLPVPSRVLATAQLTLFPVQSYSLHSSIVVLETFFLLTNTPLRAFETESPSIGKKSVDNSGMA